MSDTPETDAEEVILSPLAGDRWVGFARQLERERNEAKIDAQKSKAYKKVLKETNLRQVERIRYLEGATNHASGTPLSVALRERDEAREHIERQRLEIVRLNGATNHAGGTPLKIALRERDEWAEMCGRYKQERDEAREALMKIEDLFIDGIDIYADRENMGLIARSALEKIK